jgi:hypothetical protein
MYGMLKDIRNTLDTLSTDKFVTGNSFEQFVKHTTSLKGVVESDVSDLTMFPHDNVVVAFYGHTSAYDAILAISAAIKDSMFGHHVKDLYDL